MRSRGYALSVLKLRPVIFGLCVFNFIWMWTIARERLAQYALALEQHVPTFRFYEEVFFGVLLLIAALGLLFTRWWTQFVALILSGFVFCCVTIFHFWKLAYLAEVPLFSHAHFSLWYPNMFPGQLLQIVLSTLIVCCAITDRRRHQML